LAISTPRQVSELGDGYGYGDRDGDGPGARAGGGDGDGAGFEAVSNSRTLKLLDKMRVG